MQFGRAARTTSWLMIPDRDQSFLNTISEVCERFQFYDDIPFPAQIRGFLPHQMLIWKRRMGRVFKDILDNDVGYFFSSINCLRAGIGNYEPPTSSFSPSRICFA